VLDLLAIIAVTAIIICKIAKKDNITTSEDLMNALED